MTMPADFLDAHKRHWDDAERLLDSKRWANADHLYGMAAECGLKKLMLAFGMTFDAAKDRPADVSDRKHIDAIWTRFESYRSGHHKGVRFALPTENPFVDWAVSQRYAPQNHFDVVRVIAHQAGANLVRQLVNKAVLEGVV